MVNDAISRSALLEILGMTDFAEVIRQAPALDVAQIVTNGQDTTYMRVKSINELRHRIIFDEELSNSCAVYYQEVGDVVQAVRCKDCKYRCTQTCPMFHTEWYWDEDDGSDCYDVDRTDDDGFCHLGARMDGEDE